MDGIFMVLTRTKRILLAAALILAATTTAVAALQHEQMALSERLIRLHVVANSDSEEDQAMKLQVRDAVLAVTQPLLEDAEEPKAALLAALPEIEQAAEDCLRTLGDSHSVTVTLAQEQFPTRVYDSFALPAGQYLALRVTIGAGAGHNWWCVVFPTICFTATAKEVESAAVSGGFTESEVRLITEEGGYQLKFKAMEWVEWLQQWLFS